MLAYPVNMNKYFLIILVLSFSSCASALYTNDHSIMVYKDKMKIDSILIPIGSIWSPHILLNDRERHLRGIAIIDTSKVFPKSQSLIISRGVRKRVKFDGYYVAPEQLQELTVKSNRAIVKNRMLNTIIHRKYYDLILGWKKKQDN